MSEENNNDNQVSNDTIVENTTDVKPTSVIEKEKNDGLSSEARDIIERLAKDIEAEEKAIKQAEIDRDEKQKQVMKEALRYMDNKQKSIIEAQQKEIDNLKESFKNISMGSKAPNNIDNNPFKENVDNRTLAEKSKEFYKNKFNL